MLKVSAPSLSLLLILTACSHLPEESESTATASPSEALFQDFYREWQGKSGGEASGDCSIRWSQPITGKEPYAMPMLPELMAGYWAFAWQGSDLGGPTSFRIDGRYPHARYMSWHVYDGDTGNPISHLTDIGILPDPGSANPFLPGVDRTTGARAYTLWLTADPQLAARQNNAILLPSNMKNTVVIYRVYRADDGLDYDGGVGLPVVNALNDRDMSPATCPPASMDVPPNLRVRRGSILDALPMDRVQFYRIGGRGLYGNADNIYGVARIDPARKDQVAVLRWKPPTFPDTAGGSTPVSGREEVRYWSMCLGDLVATNTSSCLHDDAMRLDAQGYVTLVIGPDDSRIAGRARSAGMNYMSWGEHPYPILVYRNLVSGEGGAHNLLQSPPWVPKKPVTGKALHENVGDYGPRGLYCSRQAFLASGCAPGS